ncbi:MAG: ABC transporter permease [Candidatus Omnitrophica bacterium]|nr:ABC transporter permease [Candidatus Omnitrophota bacterium]
MRYELFLALRYLLGLRRQQPVVSVIAGISVLGIALGVAALLVVLGVMSGFDADLEEKIVGANPHILVQAEGGIPAAEEVIAKIRAVPGVLAASPVIQTQALVQHGDEKLGVLLRGVDPVRELEVTELKRSLQGAWPPGPDEVIVGSQLAKRWNLSDGDAVEVPGAGEKGKPKQLIVRGAFTTGMYEYDMHLVLARMETVQALVAPPVKKGKEKEEAPPAVTGIGVRVASAARAPEVKRAIQRELGYPFWATSWMEMNANLFAALKLEKLVMFIILSLIVLVACFNIVATLLMMVVNKTKEVGILKAVGATAASVRRLFTLAGLMIGAAGTALGTGLGLAVCWALAKYQFIQLPADIYYVDRLPVKLERSDITSVVAAALVISWVACMYPAWVASRLVPSQALRYE